MAKKIISIMESQTQAMDIDPEPEMSPSEKFFSNMELVAELSSYFGLCDLVVFKVSKIFSCFNRDLVFWSNLYQRYNSYNNIPEEIRTGFDKRFYRKRIVYYETGNPHKDTRTCKQELSKALVKKYRTDFPEHGDDLGMDQQKLELAGYYRQAFFENMLCFLNDPIFREKWFDCRVQKREFSKLLGGVTQLAELQNPDGDQYTKLALALAKRGVVKSSYVFGLSDSKNTDRKLVLEGNLLTGNPSLFFKLKGLKSEADIFEQYCVALLSKYAQKKGEPERRSRTFVYWLRKTRPSTGKPLLEDFLLIDSSIVIDLSEDERFKIMTEDMDWDALDYD